MVDIVREVSALRQAYASKRGATKARGITGPPSGQPIAPMNTLIPRTTWADVMLVTSHLEKYINPTQEQCVQIVQKRDGVDRRQALIICGLRSERARSPMQFVKTADFLRARENFMRYTPLAVGARTTGSTAAGAVYAVGKIDSGEEFPNNEEFWGYAVRYAIARSAAGVVPFWEELASDAVNETIRELPTEVKSAAVDAFNSVSNLLPGVADLASIIKWGTIGMSVFLVYWYVLRPRK